MSEKRSAVFGGTAERETSETVKTANLRDAIASVPYLIDDASAAMMTHGPKGKKLYEDNYMAAM